MFKRDETKTRRPARTATIVATSLVVATLAGAGVVGWELDARATERAAVLQHKLDATNAKLADARHDMRQCQRASDLGLATAQAYYTWTQAVIHDPDSFSLANLADETNNVNDAQDHAHAARAACNK